MLNNTLGAGLSMGILMMLLAFETYVPLNVIQ